MPRGDQLARQWKILQYLSILRYGKSVKDFADHLDCHTRTIYRGLGNRETVYSIKPHFVQVSYTVPRTLRCLKWL